MGFMDELKKLTRPYSEEDDEEYDDFEDEEAEAPAAPARRSVFSSGDNRRSAATNATATNSRVVSLNNNQLQVVLVKPDRFDTVSEVADHLRDKKAVILNLESTNKDVARRLVDFLSGCAYALDGKIKKVAISTYLITPYNVDIVGELAEELENNSSVYF